MALGRNASSLTTWGPVILTFAFGCATGTQGDSPLGGGQGGSTDTAGSAGMTSGTAGTAGTADAAGTTSTAGTGTDPTAGTNTTGGTDATSGTGGTDTAGTATGGTFSTSGTATGGTFSASGAGGTSAGAGGATAGTGGATAGTGGTTAGTAGKGGTGGTSGGGTGGNGGSGGAATGCAAHPIGAKTGWKASANIEGVPCVAPETIYCGPSSYAIDGMTGTRFTTEAARTGTEWLQIDFGASVTVSKLVLHTAAGSNDYTHGYEVRMAAQAADVMGSAAIVTGTGVQGDTTITFPTPQTGQFLRINQTTAIAGWWSIQEIDASCE